MEADLSSLCTYWDYILDLAISPSGVTKLDVLARALFSLGRNSVIQLAAPHHRKKQAEPLRTFWKTASLPSLRRKAGNQRQRSSRLEDFNPYLIMNIALLLYFTSGVLLYKTPFF